MEVSSSVLEHEILQLTFTRTSFHLQHNVGGDTLFTVLSRVPYLHDGLIVVKVDIRATREPSSLNQ